MKGYALGILIFFSTVYSWAAWDDIVLWEDSSGWQHVSVNWTYDTDSGWVWMQDAQVWAYLVDPNSEVPIPNGYVLIQAGNFLMGSPVEELGRFDDENQREITVTQSFFMKETEVTWNEWQTVRDWALTHGYPDLPVGRNGWEGDGSGNHPITEISWHDSVKWCNALSEMQGLEPYYKLSYDIYRWDDTVPFREVASSGYRLPTEAEWEYACRAGSTTAFYNGPITYEDTSPLDPNLDSIAWYSGNAETNTRLVKQKEQNVWGLYDTSGNVSEWCWDWYGEYGIFTTDPTGPSSGTQRVTRGGAFNSGARVCRSAFRGRELPKVRYYHTGFRPVRNVP